MLCQGGIIFQKCAKRNIFVLSFGGDDVYAHTCIYVCYIWELYLLLANSLFDTSTVVNSQNPTEDIQYNL